MQARHWWYALLMFVCAQPVCADEVADDAAADMEIIEMLGGMEDDTGDLELAMSDQELDGLPTTQEVENEK